MTYDKSYVLHPFLESLDKSHANVLFGLRLIEAADSLPPPTEDEKAALLQIANLTSLKPFSENKQSFRKWIIRNGVEDIHKCLRLALDRTYVLRNIENELKRNPKINVVQLENKLSIEAAKMNFPDICKAVYALYGKPLDYDKWLDAFNRVRNVFQHANGVVTKKFCNNSGQDELTIYGYKIKLFFKKGDTEVPVEIGKPGPENAALMMGADEFQIIFKLGQTIEFTERQFTEILNACVFIKADFGKLLDQP